MSAELIRHGGRIAPGVRITFCFDPQTGAVHFECDGRLRGTSRAEALERYRGLRFEFLRRVAAMLGGSVAVLELDEHGQPDELQVVDAPQAGNA